MRTARQRVFAQLAPAMHGARMSPERDEWSSSVRDRVRVGHLVPTLSGIAARSGCPSLGIDSFGLRHADRSTPSS
jgi:hypothetical protein